MVSVGASLHVSFPDSRPFGQLGLTYNPFGITQSETKQVSSDTKNEKFSLFHTTK